MIRASDAADANIVADLAHAPEYTLAMAAETDLPLRLRVGKPQIVHLEVDAKDVTVDVQPENLTAFMYDRKSVALFPHKTGGAHITVFDKNGGVLMARYVVTTELTQKYVSIRQICKAGEKEAQCNRVRVYYCPNLCYETHIMDTAANPGIKDVSAK